jgi:SAM-dependent methyltransferase
VSDPHRHDWEERHRRGATLAPPSPFVVAVLDLIARRDVGTALPRRALDVACGAGRHTFLLASRGYRVVAVDFARAALVALRARAAEVVARARIDAVVADATCWPVQPARFDVVVVVDFLERALFPALRAAVAPGGILLMETFMVGQERHGHPRNPAYLLRPGELRDACHGWRLLLAHEGESTAGAAPACRAGIAAARPLHVDSMDPFGSYPRR